MKYATEMGTSTKFHTDCFRHSNVNREHRYTYSMEIAQDYDHSFKNKKDSGLKQVPSSVGIRDSSVGITTNPESGKPRNRDLVPDRSERFLAS
jgi:hypothetical protein